MADAFLNSIGTSVPANDVHATFVRFARTMLTDTRLQRLFGRMAERSGIAHRFSTLQPRLQPDDIQLDQDGFYRRGAFPGSGDRMRRYAAAALPLATEAVKQLDGFAPDRITHVIVTSCTGFYAPGLDLQLVAALGLRSSVERTQVGFMGCYAAFNALKLARHIVRSEPDAQVLLVNLELCTLHLQDTADLEQILSFLVFADGCAASLVSAAPRGLRLDSFHAELMLDTEALITWQIGDQGFDMVLSGQVPGAIAAGLAQPNSPIPHATSAGAPTLWAVHPGGRSVLDAVQSALGLAPEDLAEARSVLRDYGNMSSATILFVLQRIMRRAVSGASGIAMGFGPGLVAETMRFQAA